MRKKIRDIMTQNPIQLRDDATIRDAAIAMRDHGVGGVLVTRKDGSLCGIVTDRDIVVRGIASAKEAERTKLAELCTSSLFTLSPSDDVDDAVRLMGKRAVRRVPIVDQGRPVGMVSLGDLARHRDPKSVLGSVSAAPANN